MKDQAARFGAEYKIGDVTRADLARRPLTLTVDEEQIETRTLIIASGASARWLGLESEKALVGKGVSSCATCDGFFFRDKKVVIVGGGDSAMEEALFLTRFASQVDVIHRRGQFRASKIMVDRARQNEKLHFIMDTVLDDILDPARGEVTAVKLLNVKTKEIIYKEVDGVFVAIGHIPNTAVFRGQLDMDQDGYLITNTATKTKLPGVFACGDVQDRIFRQAVTAAGSGCMAAIEAERFIESEAHSGH